jgi:hypothetical protein
MKKQLCLIYDSLLFFYIRTSREKEEKKRMPLVVPHKKTWDIEEKYVGNFQVKKK